MKKYFNSSWISPCISIILFIGVFITAILRLQPIPALLAALLVISILLNIAVLVFLIYKKQFVKVFINLILNIFVVAGFYLLSVQ
jgi:predicted neutral ceramidase superfamily lipid hydrolase